MLLFEAAGFGFVDRADAHDTFTGTDHPIFFARQALQRQRVPLAPGNLFQQPVAVGFELGDALLQLTDLPGTHRERQQTVLREQESPDQKRRSSPEQQSAQSTTTRGTLGMPAKKTPWRP